MECKWRIEEKQDAVPELFIPLRHDIPGGFSLTGNAGTRPH